MKKQKGISLIVLVITIIVMIILAGSIILSLNNTGIINKANQAVESSDFAQVKHLATLKWSEGYLDKGLRAQSDLEAYVMTELGKDLGEELDKYEITVTERGVEVEEKGKVSEEEKEEIENPEQPPQEIAVVIVGGTADNKLKDGQNITLTLETEEGTSVPVTKYESSNTTIATVNDNGVVTAKNPGQVTITLTYAEGTKTYNLTIVENVTAITVTTNNVGGDLEQLIVTTSPSVNGTGTIQYESLTPSVATVNNNGLVTILSSGSVKIKVTYTSKEGQVLTAYWEQYVYGEGPESGGEGGIGGDDD